jgi:hypothetical protein
MVRVFVFNPKVKRSNFMGGVMCGQQWYVDQIFLYRIPRILSFEPSLSSDTC